MRIISKLYIALVIFFLYAPLAVMVVFSFNSSNSTAVFEDFSFRWYTELFKNSAVLNALGNTLLLAFLSALIATVLGSAAAVGIFSSLVNILMLFLANTVSRKFSESSLF